LVPTQSIGVGSTVTVYAITRDASNNFVANVAATAWSLGSLSGGVVAGDLVPVAGNKSAVFTGHVAGAASISASSGALPVTPSGIITVSGAVGVEVGGPPLHFELMQNSPNPFHGFTTIRYELPAAAALSIKVFDVNGREVATIVEGNESAGLHSLRWDASALRSGMYFYRMDSNGRRGVRKMLIAR
jgi:hypothetical protein